MRSSSVSVWTMTPSQTQAAIPSNVWVVEVAARSGPPSGHAPPAGARRPLDESYRTLTAGTYGLRLGTELLCRPASDVRPDSACSRFHDQRSDGARVVRDGHMTAIRQRFELGAGRELIEVPGLVP